MIGGKARDEWSELWEEDEKSVERGEAVNG